jgi:hypothetical protein
MPGCYKLDLAHGESGARGVSSGLMGVFDYLIPVALGAVFLVLCFGIYTLFRGGDFSRSWSNKAMRLRVVMQFVAIVILVAAMLWKQNYG